MKKFYVCLVTKTDGLTVRRLTLTSDATQSLSDLFDEQAKSFIKNDTVKVRFSGACFKADAGEILFVDGYQLPIIYQRAITDSSAIPSFTISKDAPTVIRSVFAIDTDGQTGESMLFQSSGAAKILNNKRALFSRDGTFNLLSDPGFVIDSQLAATFQNSRLYFRSYSVVKRFLDLTDYFRAASDPQISDFLNLPLFSCDNVQVVIDVADDWMRRRFTSIQSSGILDAIDAKTAVKKAKKYGIELFLDKKNGNNAIVVTDDKKEIKDLLRFLNEEYYTGELSGRQYLTNSQTLIENVEN